MRSRTTAKKNSRTRVAATPWRVVKVRALTAFRMLVSFADGTEGEIDLTEFIFGERAGDFEVLRDPRMFARVRVTHGAVAWPGRLDLAPDAMYKEIKAAQRDRSRAG